MKIIALETMKKVLLEIKARYEIEQDHKGCITWIWSPPSSKEKFARRDWTCKELIEAGQKRDSWLPCVVCLINEALKIENYK